MIYYVYHIKLPNHTLNDGYIGVSNDPDRRLYEHKNHSGNLHLQRAFAKYEEVVLEILHCCFTQEEAYTLETFYRPLEQMGWNINKGGMHPPSQLGKTFPPEINAKKASKGPKNPMYGTIGHKCPSAKPANIYKYTTNEIIASNVVINEYCREHNLNASHMSSTARGDRRQHKGYYAKYIQTKGEIV